LPGYRKNSNKIPVVAVLERGGNFRTKVVPNVTQNNVGHFLFKTLKMVPSLIPIKARFITPSFKPIFPK